MPAAMPSQPDTARAPTDWSDWHAASALQRVVTARAVHAHEAAQPLDDAQALPEALALAEGAAPTSPHAAQANQTRVQARAKI